MSNSSHSAENQANFTTFLLSALRGASLRARLLANEIDTLGVALKSKMISIEDALNALAEIDCPTLIPEIEMRPTMSVETLNK